jgi:hypothetical protein
MGPAGEPAPGGATAAPPPPPGDPQPTSGSGDGLDLEWGDFALIAGLTAGLWLFTPVIAGLGCDFNCVHVDYSFIPIFGAWIALATAPYPDAAALVIVAAVQDVMWGFSIFALVLAIQTARRRGRAAEAAAVAELPFTFDAAPRPGGGVVRVGGRF